LALEEGLGGETEEPALFLPVMRQVLGDIEAEGLPSAEAWIDDVRIWK
jgi:hypothetical protein